MVQLQYRMCLFICVHNNNIIYLSPTTCSLCWWLPVREDWIHLFSLSLAQETQTFTAMSRTYVSTTQFSTERVATQHTHVQKHTFLGSTTYAKGGTTLPHCKDRHTHRVLGHCTYITQNITQYTDMYCISVHCKANSQQVACSCHIAPLKCSKQRSQST